MLVVFKRLCSVLPVKNPVTPFLMFVYHDREYTDSGEFLISGPVYLIVVEHGDMAPVNSSLGHRCVNCKLRELRYA